MHSVKLITTNAVAYVITIVGYSNFVSRDDK